MTRCGRWERAKHMLWLIPLRFVDRNPLKMELFVQHEAPCGRKVGYSERAKRRGGFFWLAITLYRADKYGNRPFAEPARQKTI